MNSKGITDNRFRFSGVLTFFLLLAVLFAIPACLVAQNSITSDSTTSDTSLSLPLKKEKEADAKEIKHSPHKASLYSAVLPGLGQAYNKKYWKIPIIYAGFGVFVYFINFNNKEYNKFKDAYYYVVVGDETVPPPNDYVYQYDEASLLSGKNYYRRNRDLSYILTGVWYIINIVDATVDAHLFNWEVNDDLSMKLEPQFHLQDPLYKQSAGGFKLTISF